MDTEDEVRTQRVAHLEQRLAAAQDELADLRLRTDQAEQLAHMGNYDWHIPTDTNRWSDELYRIYGHEPQSFNASYERFLGMLHPEDREKIQAVHQRAYATGEPYQMIERVVRPDGEVRHLSSNGQVVLDENGTPVRMRGTCVDITDLVHAEEAREEAISRLVELRVRRRAAMEINDNVVQGLAAAGVSLELGKEEQAMNYVQQTLAAARSMMDDLLTTDLKGDLAAGDLIRERPAGHLLTPEPAGGPDPAEPEGERTRVLLVDDAEDLRQLYRMKFDKAETFEVVGEAADGLAAVAAARELQPDLVLLDLAMPRMDGLEALPLILDAAPRARVLVLSGFNESTMAAKAIDAGARRYLMKGCPLSELVAAALEVVA